MSYPWVKILEEISRRVYGHKKNKTAICDIMKANWKQLHRLSSRSKIILFLFGLLPWNKEKSTFYRKVIISHRDNNKEEMEGYVLSPKRMKKSMCIHMEQFLTYTVKWSKTRCRQICYWLQIKGNEDVHIGICEF